MKTYHLHIGLFRTRSRFFPGETAFKERRGGPNVLLGWLEDQLAVPGPEGGKLERLITFLERLEQQDRNTVFHESMEKDRWATGKFLLNRRDQLRMLGWDGTPRSELPELVNDLADIEDADQIPRGTPERLDAVLNALENGQKLPPHTCYLNEPIDVWPKKWQPVLNHMTTRRAQVPDGDSEKNTALGTIQQSLANESESGTLTPDRSFGILDVNSRHRTCRAVTSILANSAGPDPENTVVLCENDGLRDLLDRTFQNQGLPSPGTARTGTHQAAVQVLPLLLEMLWEPVEPQTIVDFLSLSVSPIPDFLAGQLTDALSRTPGLGSRRWNETWDRVVDRADEPERIREKRETWFDLDRVQRGESVPVDTVRESCKKVSSWAKGYAESLDEQVASNRIASLEAAVRMASGLNEFLKQTHTKVSKPQLDRMLEDLLDTVSGGAENEPSGVGPVVLRNLVDVPEQTPHLIWIDITAEQEPRRHWTGFQEEKLEQAGIPVRSHQNRVRTERRDQEKQVLLNLTESLTIVRLTQQTTQACHPLWLQIENLMPEEILTDTDFSLKTYLRDQNRYPAPFELPSVEKSYEPPQPERPLWDLPDSLLQPPDHTSATEMTERLACPAKWVFNRVANLRTSSASELPEPFLLRGNFSHHLFEDVFGDAPEAPDPEDAKQRIRRLFDERVHLDAVPLALPRNYREKRDVRRRVSRAAERFAEFLSAGDYRVKEMESELHTRLEDRPVHGRIDCLLESTAGDEEAILDLKYAGRSKYPGLINDGRALQLAVYCRARQQQTGAGSERIGGTGYFLIHPARIVTPEHQPLRGVRPYEIEEGAEDLFATWQHLVDALENGSGWLDGHEPVPARPLQDPDDRPKGADLAIDQNGDRAGDPPCRYCDYKILCGLKTCE